MDLNQPGPLARRKITPPKLAPIPTPPPEVKKPEAKKPEAKPVQQTPKKEKPKKPPHKPLMMFTDFDKEEYHPTLDLAWIDGVLHQIWRNHWTNEPKWCVVPTIQKP
jgi:hypothetical protein